MSEPITPEQARQYLRTYKADRTDYMPSYAVEALETIVADHIEYGAEYGDPATGLRHVSWFEYKIDAQEELDHLRANPYNQSPRLVARRVSEPWEEQA